MWRIARDHLRLLVFTFALISPVLGISNLAAAQDDVPPIVYRMVNRMLGTSSHTERAAIADDIALFSRHLDEANNSVDEAPVVINEIVARARMESSARARIARANDLAWSIEFFAENDRLGSIDESTIANLSDMLNDENEGVVATIAAALGGIGPRAASTVPALEAALRRLEISRELQLIAPQQDRESAIMRAAIAPQQDYEHVIEWALERITGQNRATPSK